MILENELFEKWSKKRTNLVSDGIVNNKDYQKSACKILFLMKEVNNPNGDLRDLRPFLKKGGKASTWNNATRWIYGIRNLNREINWQEIVEIKKHHRKEHLRTIAVVNVKKTPGKASSNYKELWKIAREDQNLLKEQIDFYNSDIIICCGHPTGSILKELIFPEIVWKKTSRGIPYYKTKNGKIFIDYYHPAARVSSSLLFYGLYDALRELKK